MAIAKERNNPSKAPFIAAGAVVLGAAAVLGVREARNISTNEPEIAPRLTSGEINNPEATFDINDWKFRINSWTEVPAEDNKVTKFVFIWGTAQNMSPNTQVARESFDNAIADRYKLAISGEDGYFPLVVLVRDDLGKDGLPPTTVAANESTDVLFSVEVPIGVNDYHLVLEQVLGGAQYADGAVSAASNIKPIEIDKGSVAP